MNFKAIIFDLDGTIIETEHIWEHCSTALITARGVAITPDLKKELSTRLAGLALRESCSIIKELAHLDDSVELLMREKQHLSHSFFEQGVRFVKGFVPFYKKAQKLNLKMGIATNANEHMVAITNKKLNLERLFGSHIYPIVQVNNVGKPNPAIYLHAAQQLGINPKHCIAIEDSAHGIQAAKSAHMFCIGINTAKKPHLLTSADLIINGYHEIKLNNLLAIK